MSRPLKLSLAVIAVLLVAAIMVILQQFRLFERGWFNIKQWRQADQRPAGALWLPDYRVRVEARPIAGVAGDMSALTYDPDRNSLFTVTNRQPELIELSLDGEVLRRVALEGFGDAEAVQYIKRDTYVISDERAQRLLLVRVPEGVVRLAAAEAQQLTIGLGRNGNKGFEGLAYDAPGQRLFVAKERDPLGILEIRGFPQDRSLDQPFSLEVEDHPARDAGLFVRDLSSLEFDAASGHLLALSDESQLLLELDDKGRPISSLSLLAGQQGLTHSIEQAEGVALSPDGTLYLVSEPNLFYVFAKPPAGR
jgi:uncharacterized protein YjiK